MVNNANQANANTAGSAGVYAANAGQNALAGLAGIVNQGLTQSSFGTNSALSGGQTAGSVFNSGTAAADEFLS